MRYSFPSLPQRADPTLPKLAVLDLKTRTTKRLALSGSHAHYVASGHLVYTAAGALRAVPFDLARLETRGTPVTVLPRLVRKSAGAGDFMIAANGTLAYVEAPDLLAPNTLVWVDRQGREEQIDVPPRFYMQPAYHQTEPD